MRNPAAILLTLVACAATITQALADEPPEVAYPRLVERAATLAAFVPAGWRLEHAARGNLDAEAGEDALLVLRMDAPANVIENDGFGPDRFDTNPRMLVAALADANGGWRRVMANHALVPRPEAPVMDDFLNDNPASAVTLRANRTWSVQLHSWASAGTWSTREVTYTFRLEGDCMRLVGYDNEHLHRGSGVTTTTSINYLTGRAWIRAGSIEDDTPGPQRATQLASRARICIGDIGEGLAFEPDLVRVAPAD